MCVVNIPAGRGRSRCVRTLARACGDSLFPSPMFAPLFTAEVLRVENSFQLLWLIKL